MENQNAELPTKPTQLPESWITSLFNRLSAMYGNRFTDMWRGIDHDMIKKTWAEALVRFSPDSLKHALEACLDRQYPPTLPEFIDLCRARAARNINKQVLTAPEPLNRAEAKARLKQVCEKAGMPLKTVLKDISK